MKSKIFTDAEIKSLNQRLKGIKKDSTGIFGGRVRPKIKELLDKWFPKKKQLEKIIQSKKGKFDILWVMFFMAVATMLLVLGFFIRTLIVKGWI